MEVERPDAAAGFPALTRAKQRFLERRVTAAASKRAPPPHTQAQDAPEAAKRAAPTPRPKASSLELALLGSCHDLDDDLRSLTHEVHAIDAGVRQAHQRLCSDLDALTTALIDGEPQFSSSPLKPNSSHEARSKRHLKMLMISTIKKPKKTLVIARQTRQLQTKPTAATTKKPHSRVAKLTLQAVHAHVIQHHYRRFLYKRLYTGGPQQFAAARELSKRTRVTRVWRRWLQFLTQRQQLKRRFSKLASVLSTRSTDDFCALEAAKVLEEDGKYAMAKRFCELKTLTRVLRGWLRYTIGS
ncbi:hypothetical protein Gpo141_00003887 [Globisporangium polare]